MGSILNSLASGVALFAAEGRQEATAKEAAPTGSMLNMLLPFIAIFVLFYFLLIRPQRREQARRQDMLKAVKKNDRVVTAGGIYGVVANVNREGDEITIKVDEATNTKLRMSFSSVARVLGEGSSDQTDNK